MCDLHFIIINALGWVGQAVDKKCSVSLDSEVPATRPIPAHSNVLHSGAKGCTRSSHSGVYKDPLIGCYLRGGQTACGCASWVIQRLSEEAVGDVEAGC